MGEREGYEVLRLIEHNQKCYISSDYVEGKSLIQWLKYHPNLTKKQLFLWIRDLADQLECIHKCRGNPCYQYVNPYSVIVTEDMTLHFLDMSVESNEKMLVQMNRRSVRENFLPPEVNYYQAASIELDIYGLGRTIQYLLSVTDPIPELTRRETVKFQKIISRCLDGHSKRAFKQMSEIQKEIPNVTEKKSKDRRIWTKKRTVMAMISICVFVAAVSVRVIQKKGDEKNAELKMESSDGLNMSEVSEREAFVEAQRSMGLLYFLELEDYEKSIQAFEDAGEDQMSENLAALVRYVAGLEDKESSNEKKEYANEKKIENIFRKIEEWMPDDSRLDYERCLIRGYAVEESEEHAKAILRIGKKILDEKPEERLVKDQALEICRKGVEELKDSKQLRILYMRMQCSDSDISREICAQTVKEYLNQIPEIKEETEFQKLAQEYGIVMEGENVWVGR